jgi:hypothetical protein
MPGFLYTSLEGTVKQTFGYSNTVFINWNGTLRNRFASRRLAGFQSSQDTLHPCNSHDMFDGGPL